MSGRLLRNGKIWILVFVVGLVIGSGLGIIISQVYILPNKTHEAILGFAINPVQVSGTVSGYQKGSIQFVNFNETLKTRYDHYVDFVNGHYSIVLSGGYSYKMYIGTGESEATGTGSLYVPSNVTVLIANF